MSDRVREIRQWLHEEPSKTKSSNKMLYGSIAVIILIIGGLYMYNRSKKQTGKPPGHNPAPRAAIAAAPRPVVGN